MSQNSKQIWENSSRKSSSALRSQ